MSSPPAVEDIAASGTSPTSTMVAAHHITELFERLDGVEKGSKTLATETKDLKDGQQAILATLDGLQDNICRLINTSISRALQTPAASPVRQQNPYQEREYSQYTRRFGKQLDTGGTDASPINHLPDPGESADPEQQGLSEPPSPTSEGFTRKLEIPIFEGHNAFAWLSKVERFFRMGHYSDQKKRDFVAISLDGVAIGWFNSELNSEPFLGCNDFKDRLLPRFGNVYSRGSSQNLCCLQQSGPVADYIAHFEDLSSQVHTLDRRTLEGIFLNGLKLALRAVVQLMRPDSLSEIKAYALNLEGEAMTEVLVEKLQNKNRGLRGSFHQEQRQQVTSTWRTRKIPNTAQSKPPPTRSASLYFR